MLLHDLGIIKTGKVGTSKDDMNKILEPKMVPQGTSVVWRPTNDEGGTNFMVACKGKNNCLKGKKRKNNFITAMIFTDCSTTLSGDIDGNYRVTTLFSPLKWQFTIMLR